MNILHVRCLTASLLFYSTNAVACAGTSGLEYLALPIAYGLSFVLAFYAVFSRLTVKPAMVWLPIVVSVLAFYFGFAKFGCVETNQVHRALITLSVCIALAVYETVLRRKNSKRPLTESNHAS